MDRITWRGATTTAVVLIILAIMMLIIGQLLIGMVAAAVAVFIAIWREDLPDAPSRTGDEDDDADL